MLVVFHVRHQNSGYRALPGLLAKSPGPCQGSGDSHGCFRRAHGGGYSQLLVRACGLRPGYRPSIIDATAGLGKDAFVLACMGARVTMLERHPVIAALLADGLQRAYRDQETGALLGGRLGLCHVDARVELAWPGAAHRPDAIYLDPMYPPRRKAARVKKDMQLLQQLAGPDKDGAELLAVALRGAKSRVVVKRPRLAPALAEVKPDVVLSAKNTRFDIYLSLERHSQYVQARRKNSTFADNLLH